MPSPENETFSISNILNSYFPLKLENIAQPGGKYLR
jgi:hypothetical protein